MAVQIDFNNGNFGINFAATSPFVDSWYDPERAKYGVALWAFLGGANIYYSQKLKYEALMKTNQ